MTFFFKIYNWRAVAPEKIGRQKKIGRRKGPAMTPAKRKGPAVSRGVTFKKLRHEDAFAAAASSVLDGVGGPSTTDESLSSLLRSHGTCPRGTGSARAAFREYVNARCMHRGRCLAVAPLALPA